MTPSEFLAWEARQEQRHVYWDGEVFAMAGASLAHNRIVANLLQRLGERLRGRGCEALPSDLRVRLSATKFCYPDVTVLCGPAQLVPDAPDTLTNPSVVIEVISDATERFDRGEKFRSYRALSSIREVLFVSQDARTVEHFVRGGDARADGETWVLRTYTEGLVPVLGPDTAIAIDDLYRNVDVRSDRA